MTQWLGCDGVGLGRAVSTVDRATHSVRVGVFVAALLAAAPLAAQSLRIYQIDVEQADAALVVMPNGKTLLIDSGKNGHGNRIRNVMLQAGVTQIDAFLANRNEATLALTRAFLEDGALIYDARGLTPLRLAPASLAPASEGERIRVKLPYAGSPVVEGIVDDGPLATWVRDLLRAHPAQRRYDVRDVVAVRAADDHVARSPSGTSRARTRERSSATAHMRSSRLLRHWRR